MVSVFCVGLGEWALLRWLGYDTDLYSSDVSAALASLCSGEFFTFSAMVLMILSNIGQLTENMVARSFRYVSINTQDFEQSIRSIANQNNIAVNGIFASDQSSPELAGNGLKYNVSISPSSLSFLCPLAVVLALTSVLLQYEWGACLPSVQPYMR